MVESSAVFDNSGFVNLNCSFNPLMKFCVALSSGLIIRHFSLKQSSLMFSISSMKHLEEGLGNMAGWRALFRAGEDFNSMRRSLEIKKS